MKPSAILLCVVATTTCSFGQSRLIARLVNPATASAVATTFGVKLVDRTAGAPFALFETRVGQSVDLVQVAMGSDGRVLWVEDEAGASMPEHTGGGKGGTIAAIGDRDGLYGYNAGLLTQISWNRPRAESNGRIVRIAVLDTGISPRLTSLLAKVVASANFCETGQAATDWYRGQDSNGNGLLDQAVGHGSMVAGLIEQIAPKCQLINVRVADSDGVSSAWRIAKGLAFAVVNGAEVANISLGSLVDIPALNDVLDWAVEERNLLVVAPVGNNNRKMRLSPARSSKAVAVAGIDAVNKKASFSNWDSKAASCAPSTGVKSYSVDGLVGFWSGTSFASPLVAAGVADCLRRKPGPVSAKKLSEVIKSSGDPGIDTINPTYRGMLGFRLNLRRLDVQVQAIR